MDGVGLQPPIHIERKKEEEETTCVIVLVEYIYFIFPTGTTKSMYFPPGTPKLPSHRLSNFSTCRVPQRMKRKYSNSSCPLPFFGQGCFDTSCTQSIPPQPFFCCFSYFVFYFMITCIVFLFHFIFFYLLLSFTPTTLFPRERKKKKSVRITCPVTSEPCKPSQSNANQLLHGLLH